MPSIELPSLLPYVDQVRFYYWIFVICVSCWTGYTLVNTGGPFLTKLRWAISTWANMIVWVGFGLFVLLIWKN